MFVYVKNYGSSFYRMTMMLEPSEMKEGGHLGYSLAAYGNTLVAGAPGHNSVHLFEMQLHVEDCPHGHENMHDLPSDACTEQYHHGRALQGGVKCVSAGGFISSCFFLECSTGSFGSK